MPVGRQTGKATMERSMEVLKEIKNGTTIESSNPTLKLKIEPAQNLAILLLGIYPKDK